MSFLSRLLRRKPTPPPGKGWRVSTHGLSTLLWRDKDLMGKYTHRERAVAELLRQDPSHGLKGRVGLDGVATADRLTRGGGGASAGAGESVVLTFGESVNNTPHPLPFNSAELREAEGAPTHVLEHVASGRTVPVEIVERGLVRAKIHGGGEETLSLGEIADRGVASDGTVNPAPRYVVRPNDMEEGDTGWALYDTRRPLAKGGTREWRLGTYTQKSNASRAARKLNDAEAARRAEEALARAATP